MTSLYIWSFHIFFHHLWLFLSLPTKKPRKSSNAFPPSTFGSTTKEARPTASLGPGYSGYSNSTVLQTILRSIKGFFRTWLTIGGSSWEKKTLAFLLRGVDKFNHQIENVTWMLFCCFWSPPFLKEVDLTINPINPQKCHWNSLQEKSDVRYLQIDGTAPKLQRYCFHR